LKYAIGKVSEKEVEEEEEEEEEVEWDTAASGTC
jgi:hypothetical protein